MKTDFYVYLISRPDGRPCYVGKGRGNRFRYHENHTHNKHLASIYKNAAAAGLKMGISFLHADLSSDEAFRLEANEIAKIGRLSNGGPLVNMSDGGDGSSGWKATPQTKARMSLAQKGNKHALGLVRSDETRAKMSLAQSTRPRTKGHTHSPETKAKISAAQKGRTLSPEMKKRISETLLGVPLTKEHKTNIGNAQRGKTKPRKAKHQILTQCL